MENALFYGTLTPPKGIIYVAPIVIAALLAVLVWVFIGVVGSFKNTGIAIKDGEIAITSFLYGRRIPIENVYVDEVRAVDFNSNSDCRVSWRMNGIRLPGFLSGWMKLKNGKKALVFVTDKNNVLMVPTKDFVLLFSMKNSAEFIDKIKEAR